MTLATCTGRKRSTGLVALSARKAHFQLSLIKPPGTGVVETSCTELKTRDRLTSSRLRMPGLIWIRSLIAGTKLAKRNLNGIQIGQQFAKSETAQGIGGRSLQQTILAIQRTTMAPG